MSPSSTRARDSSRRKSDFLNLVDLTIPHNERGTEAKRSLFNFDFKSKKKQSKKQEEKNGGHKRRSDPIRTPSASPKTQTSSKTKKRLQLPAPVVREILVTAPVENPRVQNDENENADAVTYVVYPANPATILADRNEIDDFVTLSICEDPVRYLELRNNQGIYVSFSQEELKTCASIILQENFRYRSAADGVDFGGFLQTGPTVSSKMGLFKLAPKTVKPYEFTQGQMEIVMWVIQGNCVFRSTAHYVSNGVKYLHGEKLKTGDVFVIPPKCAYTFENWNDEVCLFGFTSMTRSETSTQITSFPDDGTNTN